MSNIINILNEIREDALTIGNETNLSRAFPYIADGLKPSQRAVIFSAYDGGYFSNRPHIKSLKLDGKVVGEIWPHGSEYSTIVRLTQPFVMNLPLLDMHGANGSQLGTPDAAASRYTEVRLSEAAEDGFLNTIKKDTCEWILNYSEDKLWPKLFPAIIPNLFINGSNGMGYCYAQTWVPGNLNEFTEKVKTYLSTSKVDCTDIYPDFPTKGIIINKAELHTIYETGIGTVILRGKAEIENNIIKITELPYQIYVTPFMEQLRKLATPDTKGITKIPGIDDIYNMSGDAGMLIEIECNDDPEIILNRLYQYSDLQISISVNQYGINNSIPELITLKDYIQIYIDHNINCINREYKYDLAKAEQRLEIVEGLLKAIDNIDTIINTIKKSKSSEIAKQNLITEFKFSEVQAKAIIDMRLGKLAALESKELLDEKSELNKIIDKCTKFLKSKNAQQKELLKRLTDFTKKYGWERRTQVTDIDIIKEKSTMKAATKVEDEFMLILTKDNYIKKVLIANYKQPKDTSDIINIIKVSAKDKFCLISKSGIFYKLPVNKLKAGSINSTGESLNTLLNDTIINIFTGNETPPYMIFITAQGKLKKMETSNVLSISKKIGTNIMKLDDTDSIVYCALHEDSDNISYKLGKKTKTLSIADFRTKGRIAGGVNAIKVKTDPIIII